MPSAAPEISHDGRAARRRLRVELDLLHEALSQEAPRAALGPARARRLREALADVLERLERPLTLAVVGSFKAGKTTLINALLGQELLSSDVTPETVLITELHRGPQAAAALQLVSGARAPLRLDQLHSSVLEPILADLPGPVDHLRVEAPAAVLDALMIVDTPGLSDALWRFDARVAEWLPKADLVLQVVNAISPLSSTERDFLRMHLQPLELSKVTFVVNGIDRLPSESDAQRVVQRIRGLTQPLMPDSEVIGISALHGLCAATGEPSPSPSRAAELDAGLAALRRRLDRLVHTERDLVRTERAISGALRAILATQRGLDQLEGLLRADAEALRAAALAEGAAAEGRAAAERAAVEGLRAGVDGLRAQGQRWMGGLIDRVEHEALPSLAGLPHEQAQRHFPFFLGEALREGVAAIVDAQRPALLGLMETATAGAEAGELDLAAGRIDRQAQGAAAVGPTWLSVDNVHIIGMFLPGVAGLLGRVVGGVLDRSKGEQGRAEAYRQQLAEAMPALRAEAEALLSAAYDGLCAQLVHRLEARGAELREGGEVVDEAQRAHQEGAAALAARQAGLAQARAALREAERSLRAIQLSLGGQG